MNWVLKKRGTSQCPKVTVPTSNNLNNESKNGPFHVSLFLNGLKIF
jgi:hypothetical protein